MDFNANIDLIIKDLEEARIIIDDLGKYPGIPAIQVELAKSKCKSAAEVIALLKVTPNKETVQTGEPVTQKAGKAEVAEKVEKVEIVDKVEKAETIEPVDKPVESFTKSEPLPKPDPDPRVEKVRHSESSIIAEKFGLPSDRINEQLGSMKPEGDLGARAKPVSNLSEAIGINDRFLFIREIFDGDREAYNAAISKLDTSVSIDDARAVLMSYTGRSEEGEAVKQLLELVKRKLLPHG